VPASSRQTNIEIWPAVVVLFHALFVVAGCIEPRDASAPTQGLADGSNGTDAATTATTRDGGATADATLPGDEGSGDGSRSSETQEASAPAGRDASSGVVLRVSANALNSCAVLGGGQVWCWGGNLSGQLGNGTTVIFRTPVSVVGVAGATDVAVGSGHACALLANGTMKCWGNNLDGELGNGVLLTPGPVRSADGGVVSDGGTPSSISLSPVAVSGLGGVTAISAGNRHTCAVGSGGTTIQCWGRNDAGQLGNGTTTDSSTPVSVLNVSGGPIRALAAGHQHTCALGSGGEVVCWGGNSAGQLGNNTTSSSSTPLAVTGVAGATAIAAGEYHTCAVMGGSVRCWGYNMSGQLGNNTLVNSPTPVMVANLSGVVAVAGGAGHTCALASGGSVQCWGGNSSGELGNGTTTTTGSPTPVPVSGISRATAITSGISHTCVVDGDALRCWGSNYSNTLGDGSSSGFSSTPVTVAGL
jgi:alpha-tubulin suppressor-like RCC1 family protein